MATLYQMTEETKALYEMLENGDIDEQVFADTVEAIGVEDKINSYCQVIKQLTADADMFADEEKRVKERKQAAKNNAERMKKSLLDFLKITGQDKVKTGTFTVARSTSKSVSINDESLIPAEFKIEQSPKIDKTAIKNAIKDGQSVPGAEICENEGVRIR